MNNNDWVTKRINAAIAANKLVSEKTGSKLKELLEGKLGESELRPKELAEVANSIIAELTSTSADPEVSDEN
jgi:hypothetical protein